MIEPVSVEQVGVDVEFDEYVPVTVTWPESSQFLAGPVYVRCVEDHRLLELKFSPSTMNLVELVLVNAPGLQRQGVTLSRDVRDSTTNAHWTGNEKGGELEHLEVRAYEDCLMMAFSAEPIDAWTGRGPVLFGTIASGLVGAIGVRWTPANQDVVLGPVR